MGLVHKHLPCLRTQLILHESSTLLQAQEHVPGCQYQYSGF